MRYTSGFTHGSYTHESERIVRLKAEIWVKAYLRICANAGAHGVVVRHGDDDAGAVFIKIRTRDGHARLYGPAPAGLDGQDSARAWAVHLAPEGAPEAEIDSYLDQQRRFDPDLWIVEIEDAKGRHFLDDWLART